MNNSTKWYRDNPGKATEHSHNYLAQPGVKEKVKEYKQAWHLKNKEKNNKRNRERTANMTVEEVLLKSSRGNARKFGREHTLSLEDIKVPELCPILRIPLIRGKGRMHGNSPTLDRVDNTKGYTPENVRVISLKANSHKSDMSKQDIARLYNYVFGLAD